MLAAGSSAAAPGAPLAARGPRVLVIDWLRGLAVVLMIMAHGYDSWLTDEAKTGTAYDVIRHLSGIPSRLFLLLVGVSAAIKFESQIRRGVPTATIRKDTAKRGLMVLVLAYVFRLQNWALSGFWGPATTLFRVDILNCIGASLLVLALVSVPRNGRPQIAASLAAAALFVALGPVIGPAEFPAWLPRPLTSYLGGQRPMAWFTLFPWAAWATSGVAIGHLWLRHGRTPRGEAFTFVGSGLIGLAFVALVSAVRAAAPEIIRYPSPLVAQMGPGAFFFRLGIIGAIAMAGWAITRASGPGFSPLRQLGQTSLLVYWVHIELCYGLVVTPLKRSLGIPAATIGIVVLTALMFGLSMAKTRYFPTLRARLPVWRGRTAGPERKRVGSSRVDLQACKLEYSIVSPK